VGLIPAWCFDEVFCLMVALSIQTRLRSLAVKSELLLAVWQSLTDDIKMDSSFITILVVSAFYFKKWLYGFS
jgi:hypothetical protein